CRFFGDRTPTATSVSAAGSGRVRGHFGRSSRSSVPSSAIQTGYGPASGDGQDSSRTVRERRYGLSSRNGTRRRDATGESLLIRQVKTGAFRRPGVEIAAGSGNRGMPERGLHQVNRGGVTGMRSTTAPPSTSFRRPSAMPPLRPPAAIFTPDPKTA